MAENDNNIWTLETPKESTWDETAASFFTVLGGRKMVLGLLLGAAGVAAEMVTKNSGGLSANLVTLLLGVYGGFAASNVASKVAFNKRPHAVTYTVTAPQPQAQAENSGAGGQGTPYQPLLDAYNTKLDVILEASNTNSRALSYIVDYINGRASTQG